MPNQAQLDAYYAKARGAGESEKEREECRALAEQIIRQRRALMGQQQQPCSSAAKTPSHRRQRPHEQQKAAGKGAKQRKPRQQDGRSRMTVGNKPAQPQKLGM